MEWKTIATVKHLPGVVKGTPTCIVFDFDGTLTTSKFNSAIWKPAFPNVYDVIKDLANTYDIYIISNQYEPKVNLGAACQRISEFIDILDLPIPAFIATQKDNYRKPRTGIWDLITNNYAYETAGCVFVGDANGSDLPKTSDLLFAVNAGMRYIPPFALFQEQCSIGSDFTTIYYTKIKLSIDIIKKYITVGYPSELSRYDLVLMVGPPASTKSTYCKKTLPDYVIVSQDILKTPAKCVKECDRLLKDDFSVVVDNCNATAEQRKRYLDVAKKYDKKVGCVYFKIPKDIALHMNTYRSITSDKHIPDIAIHKFYKSLEEPSEDEGFEEILVIRELKLEYTDTFIHSYLLDT